MLSTLLNGPLVAARLASLGWMKGDGCVKTALASYAAHFGLPGCSNPDERPAEIDRHLCACRTCRFPDVMPLSDSLQRWPAGIAVTWALENYPAALGRTAAESAFLSACLSWSSVCGVKLVPTTNPKTALLTVRFDNIDGRGRVLAYSELPDNAGTPRNLKFDSEETWTISDKPRPYELDFVRVAAHELGHSLGIGHINAGNLLQPLYDPLIRTPKAGDIAEAVARYGAPPDLINSAAQPSPGVTRLVIDIAAEGVTSVTFGCDAPKVSLHTSN